MVNVLAGPGIRSARDPAVGGPAGGPVRGAGVSPGRPRWRPAGGEGGPGPRWL